MFQFKQNEATTDRRRIFFYAVSSTDGFTPITASITSGVVQINKNGATPGTTPVSPTFTHIGSGLWYYEMTAAHLDTQGVLTVTITGTNIRTAQLIGYVYAGDPMAAIPTFPTNFSSLAITGGGAVTAGTVNDKTGYSLAAGAITSTTFGADAITASVIANGAIDAATFANDAITAAVIANGAIDSATFAAGAIDAAAIATGAIDADAIAVDAITSAKIANSAISIRLATDGTASEARIETGTVAADVWNALLASYAVNNSFGQRVLRSTTAQSTCAVTGANHIAADIHEFQPAVITAADFADSALVIGSAVGIGVKAYLDTSADEGIADTVLNRNIAGGGNGTGATTDRTVRSALRALRNKSAIVGSTLTVYAEDDTATAWTAAVSTTAGANPVTGIDPAGP